MNIKEKIALFQTLNSDEFLREKLFYDILDKCNANKINYVDYMTTHPIECDVELRRLPTADYDLCCALLTMLLREDHFNNGSFERRQRQGQVKLIVERIIELLSLEELK